jgi:hypothetical protein
MAQNLQPRKQLRERNLESLGNKIKIQNRNIPFPSLNIGQKTPIDAYFLRHLDLSPPASLAELSNSVSQSSKQVGGHPPASWPVA